jgi:hypothetical protein
MTPSAGCFAPATKKEEARSTRTCRTATSSKDLTVPAPSGMTFLRSKRAQAQRAAAMPTTGPIALGMPGLPMR